MPYGPPHNNGQYVAPDPYHRRASTRSDIGDNRRYNVTGDFDRLSMREQEHELQRKQRAIEEERVRLEREKRQHAVERKRFQEEVVRNGFFCSVLCAIFVGESLDQQRAGASYVHAAADSERVSFWKNFLCSVSLAQNAPHSFASFLTLHCISARCARPVDDRRRCRI